MKYPIQCFQKGTRFETVDGDWLEIVRTPKDTISDWGGFACLDPDGGFSERTEKELSKYKIEFITAECLAELARGNKERVTWVDWNNKVTVHSIEGERSALDYKQKEDEPLGEFFLKVAKQRKYLK